MLRVPYSVEKEKGKQTLASFSKRLSFTSNRKTSSRSDLKTRSSVLILSVDSAKPHRVRYGRVLLANEEVFKRRGERGMCLCLL